MARANSASSDNVKVPNAPVKNPRLAEAGRARYRDLASVGFQPLANPAGFMEIAVPGIYKRVAG